MRNDDGDLRSPLAAIMPDLKLFARLAMLLLLQQA